MKTVTFLLLATLCLVNARHRRQPRHSNQDQLSKIVELLEDISKKIVQPPPQIVYVPYPIVFNAKPTPDPAASALAEDRADDDIPNTSHLSYVEESVKINKEESQEEKTETKSQDYDDEESFRFEEASDDEDYDGKRPVAFDSSELDPTAPAPPVEHGSSQAGLDLDPEEEEEGKGSEKEVVPSQLGVPDYTLAILTCCQQSEVAACFELFNCSKIYVPGITCLKDVTNKAAKELQKRFAQKSFH